MIRMKKYEKRVCMLIIVMLLFLTGHLTIYTWDGGITIFGVSFYSSVFVGDTLIVIGFIIQIVLLLWIVRDEVHERKAN